MRSDFFSLNRRPVKKKYDAAKPPEQSKGLGRNIGCRPGMVLYLGSAVRYRLIKVGWQ